MKLEHVGYNVPEPAAMADWWQAHLGFEIVFRGPAPEDGRFLRDSSGQMLLELYHNPADRATPDYASRPATDMHVAIWSDDVEGDAARLARAGAKVEEVVKKPSLALASVRDPWGVPIQLIWRAAPMLKA